MDVLTVTVEAEIIPCLKQNTITTNLPFRNRLCTAVCSPQVKLQRGVYVTLLI